jgi:hypothetical protein
MQNGLLFLSHAHARGVKGRDSGILILRDGRFRGGGPCSGRPAPTSAKGELRTNQHTPLSDPFLRTLSGGQEVATGFSGTFADDQAEVFGTTPVGTRSLSFHATLKRLADN